MKLLNLKSLLCLALMLFSNPAIAHNSTCKDPKAFVKSSSEEIVEIIANEKYSEDEKEETLISKFKDIMDIKWMGKFVLGINWRKLSKEQKTEYLEAYENYLIASYVPRFKEYDGQKVTILNSTPLKRKNEYLVYTSLEKIGDPTVEITYRLRKSGVCFQANDLIAEGVSLINTQRQDFSSVYKSKGYDKLIELLKEKTKK